VELTSSSGETTSKGKHLHWQTASEENNKGFDIERSIDGKNWETIDFVQGNGTTLMTQDYTYIDKNPVNENSYYRLK
jgi:hypothetical protein